MRLLKPINTQDFELDTVSSVERHAKLLSAMANEKRLQILKLISEQEFGVGELALKVGLSQSALSQHLAKLKADELVVSRRRSQNIYYSTTHPGVRAILMSLECIQSDAKAE